MKSPRHIWKVLVLVVATAPVLFVAFQNAAPADPCSGSTLCSNIFQAMKKPSAQSEGLTDAQLIDHAANRFGYGLSSLNRSINGQDADTNKVRQVARFLADSIEHKESFVSAQLNLLSANFEYTLPKTGFKMRPLSMTMTDLYDLQRSITLLRKDAPVEEKKDFSRDINRARGHTSQAAESMRLLMDVFGSQRMVDGKLVETQVNMNGVLEEFWFNHFNVDQRKTMSQTSFGPGGYERTIYNQMHTSFATLLKSVITHPAMITYLDNQANKFMKDTLSASNQNLGRELIELHTLGVGPGGYYKQDSVEGSALLLTGLNTNYKATAPTNYGTHFFSYLHVPDWVTVSGTQVQTAPVVMGHRFCLNSPVWGAAGSKPIDCPKIANSPDPVVRENRVRSQLYRYLDFLANHPRTQRNICSKLVTRFMTGRSVDDPASSDPLKRIEVSRRAVIDRCIAAWGNGGDLTAIYKGIVTSPEFWNRANYRTFNKNPHELVISSIRTLGIDVRKFTTDSMDPKKFAVNTYNEISYLGLPFHRWETPTGYPLSGSRWLTGGLLVRWTAGAFNIANLYEKTTGNSKSLPLMQLKPGQGLLGSRELAYDNQATLSARANYLKDALGQMDITRENSYGVRLIDDYSTDPDHVSLQLIGGKATEVPFKTALNLKLSNIFFIRK